MIKLDTTNYMQGQEQEMSDGSDSTIDHVFQEMNTPTVTNQEAQTAKLPDEENASEDEPLTVFS